MANNINQIKAAIEANLATIRDAYYAALNSDSSPEGVETARANYATALKSAQLNALTLLNDQIEPSIVDLGIFNVMAKIGMANPSVMMAEEVKESKGNNENKKCIDLFNDYLKTLKELLDLTGYGNALYMKELGDFIQGNAGVFDSGKDGPVDCWLACELIERLKKEGTYSGQVTKGLFENCREYILRCRNFGDFPLTDPKNPFQIPTWPEDLTPGKVGASPPELTPTVFEEQEKRIKELLEQIKGNPSGNQPMTACKDLYKQALDWMSERLNFGLHLIGLLQRLKELYRQLNEADCFGRLHLDVIFRDRQIGRFGSIDEFGEWWWEWFKNPFASPDLKTFKDSLTSAQYEDLQNYLVYRGRPDRFAVARLKYETWKSSPESTRSIVPPIWKDTFAMFDNTDFDDETIFRYFYGTVLRGDYVGINLRWTSEEFEIFNDALNDLVNYYAEGDV